MIVFEIILFIDDIYQKSVPLVTLARGSVGVWAGMACEWCCAAHFRLRIFQDLYYFRRWFIQITYKSLIFRPAFFKDLHTCVILLL